MSTKTAKTAALSPAPPKLNRLMYSRAETAEMLGVSVGLVKRWQLSGKLRATKPGGDNGGDGRLARSATHTSVGCAGVKFLAHRLNRQKASRAS